CEHVPANPARNWEEAVQSLWMIQSLVQIENFHITNCPARIDQYMYPFYKKSVVDEKTMSRVEALEFLECLFVKLNENAIICDYMMATLAPGQALSLTMTIGGQTREGKDACNEVTMLCLEAEEHVGLAQPEIAMRLWEGTPEKYLRKAAEVLRMGRGKPKFISDRTAVRMAAKGNPGLTEADYREYAVGGCTELTLPHIEMLHSWEGVCIVPKILELVMFNGKCILCEKQIGPATGDPRTFTAISDLLKAYKVQLNYWMRLLVRAIKAVKEGQAERVMIPFCSSLTEGPLQKGLDIAQGGTWYNNCGIYLAGLADTSDSLAVIDKLIYRDKKITWDQLLEAIKDNWQGHEDLRQLCLNGVPKYGNDDDFADDWAIWVMDSWYDCVDDINNQKDLAPKPYRDGLYVGSGIIGQSNVGFGMAIAATPNGRIHPNPLAECNSPFPGVDRSGPTGVIKSISKLPAYRFAMGGVLNLKLSPELVGTETGIDGFIAFLKSVEELGVYQTQYNVVSSNTLREAMKEPEHYRDLLVRVASYCVYFVECTEEQQLDIISRTEHQGW
ncbi:pyruvate formate lyase family protein, partial [Thermodesulfobacteriota bacterium]